MDEYEEYLLTFIREAAHLASKASDAIQHPEDRKGFEDHLYSSFHMLDLTYRAFLNSRNKKIDWENLDIFQDQSDPIDWAEEQARQIVSQSVEIRKAFAQRIEDLPFVLSYALALELRMLRHDFQKEADSKVQNKAKARTRQLRQELMSPSFLAQLCRERATELDERGYTGEAGVLRESATILEEDFK